MQFKALKFSTVRIFDIPSFIEIDLVSPFQFLASRSGVPLTPQSMPNFEKVRFGNVICIVMKTL